jgi:hypothetical protein
MNWRLFFISLVFLFLLPVGGDAQQPPPDATVPSPDASHPPVEAIPLGEDKIVSLSAGQEAPFGGQLFDPSTAIRWGNWLMQYKYRLVWDVELEQKVCTEEKTYRDSLLVIEKDRAEKVETSLRTALRESEKERLEAEEAARNPPWYSTMEFGMVMGAVVTAGVVALAVWAVDAGTGK